jgi:inner membrane protein
MPTVMTHAVVGMTLGTLTRFPPRWPFWIASAIVPVLPDLDVLGLPFGVGFASMWGHRGISHSFVAALVIGALASALLSRTLGARAVPLALYFATITASHGLLDALTNGGPGVAFLAPFDDTRHFFAWRPIPVSPLAQNFFSEWGWRVFRTELVLLWLPSALVGSFGLANRRRRKARPAGV